MTDLCPLCKSPGAVFYRNDKQLYYHCDNCFGIFLDETLRLDREAEKARYREHNNDIDDKKYQKFVSPISSAIMRDFSSGDRGLDFGAGTGPVISRILKDNQFLIEQYDPFFHDYPDRLNEKYDYIACCEVVEHFHDPHKEFKLLKKLLLPEGKLYCMTELYNESIDFSNWYYKNDPTHVFFYQKKTIHWIKEKFEFRDVTIEGRLITWVN
ncbi:MAG: methyltransferase domain-containing protein [Candidatus Krumholzibacteria bacterium]|nr:methyltransferase domain-containing protein [Candidatus Krumholzibacteria bacterium]